MNYKKIFNLSIIFAFLAIFSIGCRAQQTQTGAEKPVLIPAVTPAATPNSAPQKSDGNSADKRAGQKDSAGRSTADNSSNPDFKVAKSGDLGYLKKWVGKYTFGSSTKKQKSFFALPEIKSPLQNLLGAEKYNKLLDGFARPLPVTEQNNYLIFEGISLDVYEKIGTEVKDHLTHALMTIDLETGNLSVSFVTQNGDDSTFETYGDFDRLPENIQKKIKAYIYPKTQ